MRVEKIANINFLKNNRLMTDFVLQNESLKDFVGNFTSLSSLHDRMRNRKHISNRKVLFDVICRQYLEVGLNVPDQTNLLLKDNCFTVTTGHQLCLFGGPQYFIHKIISTIKLAQQLNQNYPESKTIPIFWMASEDHDFEEINYVNLFGRKISAEFEYGSAVGELSPSVFSECLEELKQLLGENCVEAELIHIFNEAFKLPSWSAATRYWVANIFKDTDLLILDANESRLKAEFKNLMKQEICEQFSHKAVSKQNDKLTRLGYNTQVNPRAINLFLLAEKGRLRIDKDNLGFKLVGADIRFSEDQLLAMLDDSPEKFSPNVVLRPLYQEYILPNIAYVGGPGEIAYWLQLKEMFQNAGVDYPALVLRDFFFYAPQSKLNLLPAAGLELSDVFDSEQSFINRIVNNLSGEILNFSKEKALLSEIRSELIKKVDLIDKSRMPQVEAEVTKIENQLNRFFDKLLKAQKDNLDVDLNRLLKFRSNFFKGNVPQERIDSFIHPYITLPNYITELIAASNVFDASLKVICY